MAETTTIKIRVTTKKLLDMYREIPSETYDEILRKMVKISDDIRNEPKLSRETVRRIQEARQDYAKGKYHTEEEVYARLGIQRHVQPGRTRHAPRPAKRDS